MPQQAQGTMDNLQDAIDVCDKEILHHTVSMHVGLTAYYVIGIADWEMERDIITGKVTVDEIKSTMQRNITRSINIARE